MSFYTEWTDRGHMILAKGLRGLDRGTYLKLDKQGLFQSAKAELSVLNSTLDLMAASKIIKIPDSQLQEFFNVTVNTEQDFTLLHSPFPSIYFDITPPLKYPKYWDEMENKELAEVRIHSMMLSEIETRVEHTVFVDGTLMPFEFKLEKAWRLTMFVPVETAPENTFVASFGIDKDNKIVRPMSAHLGERSDAQHARYVDMAIHVMNYLTSPTIVLERRQHDAALQRARQKRGRTPLPDWYEIRYAKSRHESGGGGGVGAKHGFRYDVRGHFAHFKKGKLAGRVIWIPAHQRGITHETYRPKIYRIGD
jgi:hypothetical protein